MMVTENMSSLWAMVMTNAEDVGEDMGDGDDKAKGSG